MLPQLPKHLNLHALIVVYVCLHHNRNEANDVSMATTNFASLLLAIKRGINRRICDDTKIFYQRIQFSAY